MAKDKVADPFEDIEFTPELNTAFQTRAFVGRMRETPEEKARRVLVAALEEQLKLLRDPSYTREVGRYVKGQGKVVAREAPKPIWVEQDDGTCFVTVRYGLRGVNIKPGMPTAKMRREQVEGFVEKVIELVKDGHYDEELARLSVRGSRTE